MAIRIEPYTTEEQAAGARALNQRLRSHEQTEYLLSESAPRAEAAGAAIRNHFYLVQEDDAVRGGFLLAAFPAVFGDGRDGEVLNAREPLSEALIDPKYALLGLRMHKFMERQGAHLFALGMGSESRPFPRLLKGAKWTLSQTPFLFRVVRARRALLQLQPLRTSPARRIVSAVAANTGLGKAALTLLQYRAALAAMSSNGLTIEPVQEWGGWVDDLWALYRGECSFAVSRDLKTVRELYPLDDRDRGYLVRRKGQPVAWMATRITRMRGHKQFGDLCVATVLDGVALPDAMRGAVSLVSRAMARDGADLLVTNQSHMRWVEAYRAAGYLPGPSNYILALSRQLAAEIAAQPDGASRMHFTRGDSDGRCHL
jgi:hypothetical protein